MARTIRILSGGAAHGLVSALKNGAGFDVQGEFGAVGAMRDRLLAGTPCDVLILTQALVDQLTKDGHLVAGSATPLGIVKTGVAVMAGRAHPPLDTREQLEAVLRGAGGIFLPDPQLATAGIHFMKVLRSLGLDTSMKDRFHAHPNGATAMRAMAQSGDPTAIGCTQVTEIVTVPGVELAGLLPREFELATVYTAAVCTRAQDALAAQDFIGVLAGADAAAARAKAGFEALA